MMRACALVPWNANALAPTQAFPVWKTGAPRQDLAAMVEKLHRKDTATYGLHVRKCDIPTILAALRFDMAATMLIRPEGDSVCVIELFVELKETKSLLLVCFLYCAAACIGTAKAAFTSIGSPSAVPVPCICKAQGKLTSHLSLDALSIAARITDRWAGPFGAVIVLDRPSWFVADPATSIKQN